MSAEKTLSYQYDEIMKFQKENNLLPKELVTYCIYDTNNNMPNLDNFEDTAHEIIDSVTKGIDQNVKIFRNYVKLYVNTINQSNYNDFLEKLKDLDYTNKENIHFLASELIVGSIRCAVSVRGFTFEEDPKFKTVPEVCADVAQHFSTCFSKGDTGEINFHNEINGICQQYFIDFLDMNKSMDENNEDTSENYKGFMTFMGLLFSRSVINIKIVVNCMDMIKRAIYATSCIAMEHMVLSNDHNCCKNSVHKMTGTKKQQKNELSKLLCYFDCNKCPHPTETNPFVTHHKHIECINLHKGYCHLLNHVVRSLDVRSSNLIKTIEMKTQLTKNENVTEAELLTFTKERDSNLEVLEKLCEFVNIIIKSHQEMINLNKCYNSISSSLQTKTRYVAPLKPHSVLEHNGIGSQLNKLQEKLSVHVKQTMSKYEPPSKNI